MKKISIIVPAYNAHNTLARCLETLVHQTLQDIEIIVVNDASTDDTWEIMQEYESKYPDLITIVNCEKNSKAGGARNIGFDMATGEYIGMVDSDDYVATTMYEQLYEKAKVIFFEVPRWGLTLLLFGQDKFRRTHRSTLRKVQFRG